MDEYWDVYNQFRERTGKVIKRDGIQRLYGRIMGMY